MAFGQPIVVVGGGFKRDAPASPAPPAPPVKPEEAQGTKDAKPPKDATKS